VQHRESVCPIQKPLEFGVPELFGIRGFEAAFGDIFHRCVEAMSISSVPIERGCCDDVAVHRINAPEPVAILHDGAWLNIGREL